MMMRKDPEQLIMGSLAVGYKEQERNRHIDGWEGDSKENSLI
jgi:hypothetical protein